MLIDVYLRPLQESDAKTSYKWRNDPEIWKYTGSKPDKEITLEIEHDWIKKVLKRKDEQRFAICLKDLNSYIGNVQLTNITDKDAEFHIFIGDKAWWGKGAGSMATKKMIEYGFEVLKLEEIYLFVREQNIPAIKSYKKNKFVICGEKIDNNNKFLKMVLKK